MIPTTDALTTGPAGRPWTMGPALGQCLITRVAQHPAGLRQVREIVGCDFFFSFFLFFFFVVVVFFFFCVSRLYLWGSPFFFFCVSQLYLWGSPFSFFFCIPQLYLWGSPPPSVFPGYISGVHPLLLLLRSPSYISGVHHSSSSAFPAISQGFTIFSSSAFPAISLGFTILLLLRSQLYLWVHHSSSCMFPAISLGSPFSFFFCVSSYISGFHHSSASALPAISLGFTILGEIFAYVR